MPDLFVLVHSPLAGPLTWSPVAESLHRRGIATLLPTLEDAGGTDQPYWQQEVLSVTRALVAVPAATRLVLVGHSGAGALLPAIGQRAGHPIRGYLFVDAVLPLDGTSRLDEMASSAPELAQQLRGHLAAGGRFPEWGEEELREVVPDEGLRRRLVAELRPRPLAFFEEPIPGFAPGQEARCAYLQFGTSYAAVGRRAQQGGWPYRQLAGAHFHMLVDPAGVAAALVDLAEALPEG